MRKLSFIIKEAKGVNTNWPKSQPYISVDTNKEYLTAATRLLSKEAKLIISYLISNPEVTDDSLKALVKTGGSTEQEKNVVDAVKHLKQYRRLQEIPMFQEPEQTEAIIDKKATVDELILDFETEKGRADIVKRYEPLVHRIANGYKGKTEIPFEDILQAANVGLTLAMNKYGKNSSSEIKKDLEKMSVEIEADDTTEPDKTSEIDTNWISFGVFASQHIRFAIINSIKDDAHTVKVPAGEQQKERRTMGSNIKSRSISGDAEIGTDKSGKSTVFDKVLGDRDNGVGGNEANAIMSELYNAIANRFSERDTNIFLDIFGINSEEKIKSKDIAKKYGMAASNVTAVKEKILKFIRKSPYLMKLCQEAMEFYNECAVSSPYKSYRVVESIDQNKKFRIVCG